VPVTPLLEYSVHLLIRRPIMLTAIDDMYTHIALSVTRWHECHEHRMTLPHHRGNRRCLGIAALVDRFDHNALALGDRTFLPNHAITWMSVRDIPPGLAHQPLSIHRRGATFVSTTKAVFRYNMPLIDFTTNGRDTRDLKRQPVPSHKASVARPDMFVLPEDLRQFDVAVAISEGMTQAAAALRKRVYPAPPIPFPRPYFMITSALPRCSRTASCPGQQGIGCAPGKVFLAAWTAARFRMETTPGELWWDVSALSSHLDAALETFVLPPLLLPHWNTTYRQIAGETAIIVQHPVTASRGHAQAAGRPGRGRSARPRAHAA
jgi:hypothetical protein